MGLIAVCLVCLVAIPMQALASLDIVPGQSATVSDTGGDPINLRVTYRDSHPPTGAGPHVGFRCARSL